MPLTFITLVDIHCIVFHHGQPVVKGPNKKWGGTSIVDDAGLKSWLTSKKRVGWDRPDDPYIPKA